MANREEASLCWELTQPKDRRMVNMACTRSTGETDRQTGEVRTSRSWTRVPAAAQLTADLLSGRPGLFEEGVREGLARGGLAGPAASQSAHAVVPPGAHHVHIHPFDQSSQSRGGVPHRLPSPRPRSLEEGETGEGGKMLDHLLNENFKDPFPENCLNLRKYRIILQHWRHFPFVLRNV